MQNPDYRKELEGIYEKAIKGTFLVKDSASSLSGAERKRLDTILEYAERNKGVLTVLLASVFYKLMHPKQDIRYHQHSLPGGYSGRTFDTRYITPFLKSKNFPAMAESGWLTRSLEQNSPYTLQYRGSIRPLPLKGAFLETLDAVQKGADCEKYLTYLFWGLMGQRDKQVMRLAKPTNIPISTITNYLTGHFNSRYASAGAARLPVIAFYSIYECLIEELERFKDKKLLPLESHTASDTRSKRIGDIEVDDNEGRAFEGVEVKHGIEITLQLVKDAYAKFNKEPVQRYYILSTAGVRASEAEKIKQEIEKIRGLHGCQVIANGISDSLKYYLRLLSNPADFIERYATNLEKDGALKFEHKERWNQIVGSAP